MFILGGEVKVYLSMGDRCTSPYTDVSWRKALNAAAGDEVLRAKDRKIRV
jgi:hypothetical protein